MRKFLNVFLPLILLVSSFALGHYFGREERGLGRKPAITALGLSPNKQPSKKREKRERRMKHRLVKKLNLSSKQQSQLDELFIKKRRDMEVLREEFLPRLKDHKREMNQGILAILDSEQKEKFRKLKKHRKRRSLD